MDESHEIVCCINILNQTGQIWNQSLQLLHTTVTSTKQQECVTLLRLTTVPETTKFNKCDSFKVYDLCWRWSSIPLETHPVQSTVCLVILFYTTHSPADILCTGLI